MKRLQRASSVHYNSETPVKSLYGAGSGNADVYATPSKPLTKDRPLRLPSINRR